MNHARLKIEEGEVMDGKKPPQLLGSGVPEASPTHYVARAATFVVTLAEFA
jgi:hypothetical protein